LKLGVGGKPEGGDLADHVLSGFDRDTEPLIRKVIENAGAAVLTIMKEGAEAAMNKYNGMKISV
ncbi:MAG: aminoacyl-tRNA hydrolase, partial [Lachnospiraceae bacterium]|nr:aminoacyl-tRNA hydrolase [Lachnospiraceae bacterium]